MDDKKQLYIKAYVLYILAVIAMIVVIVRICYIQYGDVVPNAVFMDESGAEVTTRIDSIEPSRGRILADDYSDLVTSVPLYNVFMDLTVMNNELYQELDSLAYHLAILLPDKTKSVARTLVQKLVKELEKKLKPKLQFAVQSGLFSRSKPVHPNGSIIDWKKTIHRNIKNYQPDQLFIIPEVWYGYKQGYKINEIILLIDKSESMISSAIYASIIGSILASLKSVQTHIIFFASVDFEPKFYLQIL